MLPIYLLAIVALAYAKPQTNSLATMGAFSNPLLNQNLLQNQITPFSSLLSNNLHGNSLMGNGLNSGLYGNSLMGNGLNSGLYGHSLMGNGLNSGLYGNSLMGNGLNSGLYGNSLMGNGLHTGLYGNNLIGNGLNSGLYGNSLYNPAFGLMGDGMYRDHGMSNSLYGNSLLGNSMYGMNPLMGGNTFSSPGNLNLLSSGLTSNNLLNRGSLLGLSGVGMSGLGSYNSGLGSLSSIGGFNGLHQGLFNSGFGGLNGLGYSGLTGSTMGNGMNYGSFGHTGLGLGVGPQFYSNMGNNLASFGAGFNPYASSFPSNIRSGFSSSQGNNMVNPVNLSDDVVNRVKAIVANKVNNPSSQDTVTVRTNSIRTD